MKMLVCSTLVAGLLFTGSAGAQANDEGDFSYHSFVDSPRRIKCLYGYVAAKTGDHASAIRIFEDCIERWNDVYSMIWLAQIIESGVGTERDETRAARLMERGAKLNDAGGYATLARYHWGIALAEGRGVPVDTEEARFWLQRASSEGERLATDYLRKLDPAATTP